MKAVLGLEDGTIIQGEGFGAEDVVCGELVFATPFTGYEEALTDPSYKGQILMFTYPLIGNYGVSDRNFQSNGIKAEGFVVRERCEYPSHHQSKRSIHRFLEDEGIPGIAEVDTRMLTIKTRERGTLKAALMAGPSADPDEAIRLAREQPDIADRDLVHLVTCPEVYRIEGSGPRFVVIDLGIKQSMIDSLRRRDADLVVVPEDTRPEDVMAYEPDAIFLSNGPGNPERATGAIKIVKELAGEVPMFGICFGNQIISLGLGAETYKLKFGHRGANQPVKNLETGSVAITSQNHGFAVRESSVEGTGLKVVEKNLNDDTVEGVEDPYLNIRSVQYHPEANPGPHDTEKTFFDEIVRRAGGG